MSYEKLILSHSEITNFNECQRKHFYSFILGLQPYNISEPLQYGIHGHKMLEAYYNEIKSGGTFEKACLAAYTVLDKLKDNLDVEVFLTLDLTMQKYFARYRDIHWKIIEVEKTIIVEFPDKPYNYGFKVDLIVEITDGKYKGKVAIIDHKFTYNFWTPAEIRMDVQLPRYIWGARQKDYNIDLGIIAQIRYRQNAVDLFKHEPIEPTKNRIESSIQEFYNAAEEAYKQHLLGKKEALKNTKRALSKLICKYCNFKDPCIAAMEGNVQQHSALLATNYSKSDYGYNND